MPSLGNPTLLQLRTRVRVFIDEVSQANFSDTSINYAINESQQSVATAIAQATEDYFVTPTSTPITILANTPNYALAADCWKIIKIQDSTTGLRIPYSKFGQRDKTPNVGGLTIPVTQSYGGYTYSLLGGSIVFDPTPTDTAFKPEYWYVPILPDMTADSDTSSIPRNFVDLVAIDAAIDMLIQDEDDTSALERKYNRRWQQMVMTSRDRQQQEPRRVTRT